MPLLWTAVSYVAFSVMNPAIRDGVAWFWFVISQLIFGVVAAIVFMLLENRGAISPGLIGGAVGGLVNADSRDPLEPRRRPRDLVSGQLARGDGDARRHRADSWTMLEAVITPIGSLRRSSCTRSCRSASDWRSRSCCRGCRRFPAPIAWGGLLMPLLWTALSYGMMGVVNPVLQERVDWPWFVVSQFVFGIVAAIVIVRSEEVHIPPAGEGPDRSTEIRCKLSARRSAIV